MNTPAKEGAGVGPAITFEDVRMGFEEGEVLRGVTCQVQERETLVLMGETGTGKTLTLKMAAGLLAPNSGSVVVLGKEVSEMPERELLTFRLRDVYGVTALLATQRLQDGFALANFHFDPATRRVVPNAKNGNGGAATNTARTRFLVYKDGGIYFEGEQSELANTGDPYLKR